jgi:putative tryptophan/tyrosine transport system substrate-binding protein
MTSVMDRRAFIVMVGASVLATSIDARAQQAVKTARIGYLAGNLATGPSFSDAFRQGLRDLGYVEGRDVVIEYQDAQGKAERLPALAAELVARKVDIILAPGTQHAMAAKQATTTIPVVFADISDPESRGLVASLARPGGNITGLSNLQPDLIGKSLELLKQAVPGSMTSLSSGSQMSFPSARNGRSGSEQKWRRRRRARRFTSSRCEDRRTSTGRSSISAGRASLA